MTLITEEFDVGAHCVNFSWTPGSFTALVLISFVFIACHVCMGLWHGRLGGFLEGHERICSGIRLTFNLLWYGAAVEVMAKLRSAGDGGGALYSVTPALVALGQIMRCQALIGLLLSMVAQVSPFDIYERARRSDGLPDEGIRAHGLSRICRHSMCLSLFLYSLSFGFAPSTMGRQATGDIVYLCDVLFWGVHCLVSVAAIWIQERRLCRDPGGCYDKYIAESSILPSIGRIFAMSLMEMRMLVVCMTWSAAAVGVFYVSPFRGYSQSACGGWILDVYALFHCTRDMMLEQMSGSLPRNL